VDFEWSEEERRFRAQVRSFIASHASSEVADPRRDGMGQLVDSPERRAFMKELSQQGWIGMSWPKEYGGSEAPGIYEYLLNEELAAAGAPFIGKGVGIVGKTIIRHGNARLKGEFLPKILNSEIEFAIGYSEPNAGSDLASLQMRATKVEGGWQLNGQKRFTTSAHFADWYWVAGRTDPDAPKHKGVTLFLVPMNAPGITITNMDTIGDERTNEVFLDDVFVSDDYVVGEVNKGWYYISEALDFERFTLFTVSAYIKRYERLRDWVREATVDGKPLREDPHVRRWMARAASEIEVARTLCLRVISKAAAGEVPNIESAMFKLFTTQLGQAEARSAVRADGRPVRVHLSVLRRRHSGSRHQRGPAQHHRPARARPPRPDLEPCPGSSKASPCSTTPRSAPRRARPQPCAISARRW
jgi:alkylation response protein AidB-like acyl-CoA dehydrogenase